MNHVNAIRCNDEYQCSHCGKSWDIHEDAPDCYMTLVSFEPLDKSIFYFGLGFIIPYFMGFIYTDKYGNVCVSVNEPEVKLDRWLNRGRVIIIARVNLHGLDWRETLRKC